jgi:hypothetical protein
MTDNNEVFVASREKAKNGYGQNGFQGPSSDQPGQHTTSGFLPAVSVPNSDWQTRKVSGDQYAPAGGMKSRNDKIAFPTDNARRATTRAPGGHFQRR